MMVREGGPREGDRKVGGGGRQPSCRRCADGGRVANPSLGARQYAPSSPGVLPLHRRGMRGPARRSKELSGGMQMMSVNGRHEVRIQWISTELRPCPRCGNARSVIEKQDVWGAYIDCLSCGWHGYEDPAIAEAPDAKREGARHHAVGPGSTVGIAG